VDAISHADIAPFAVIDGQFVELQPSGKSGRCWAIAPRYWKVRQAYERFKRLGMERT
jgi:hypothetical protein